MGIIGYPIKHSMSPAFQNAAIRHHGLDMTYEAWEVPMTGVREFVAEVRTEQSNILGFNVTVPHKEMVMEYVDELSPEAKRAQAVNTIMKRDGRLFGHNTDGLGFVRALKEEAGFSAAGKRVLILGAGGAARGVVMALASEGMASVAIANRTVDRAKRLVKDLKQGWKGEARAIGLSGEEMEEEASQADLIVQCTTMGMLHGGAERESALSREQIPSGAVVYELVYNPPVTPLMQEASKSGARVLGGLSMLIYQGAVAFELWTGKPAPVDVMFKAARKALMERTS